MRADARRNYERIVSTAQQAFTELGPDAALEEIARRAGVGIGTLYRHFPSREVLIEAVYRSNIEALSARAGVLLETHSPETAFEYWLREHVAWVRLNRVLATTLKAGMDRNTPTFQLCRTVITAAAAQLLDAARAVDAIRPDIEAADLLRLAHGIGIACESTTPEATERMVAVTIAGLRSRD
ncbi:TetR/AcrR family transcriptional regulator [Nocardia yunnanensis]|uniref:TetR/AcrR family transcriptional regulator n=2 Tax=Nocardia yunnanensis TaxID=2382165 RepID=A0A386ZHS2_9NOCA|nr:TetR/AcrR family transcriptional regulator [Nocardia yunnanensis]